MSQQPLRIGFVGAGFNTRFHIQSLTEVRDCEVMGVVSHTKASAESAVNLAKELGVGPSARAFDSVEEMTADSSIDALWLSNPNHTRIPVMEEVLAGSQRRDTPLKGICLEKPLARTLQEALQVKGIADEIGVPTGYLENMLWAPSVVRAREILWRRGAKLSGRPYLARATEEHSGPHSAWFWQRDLAGGGALLDMMCHSIEAARWLLTEPGAPRSSLTPEKVSATVGTLKWNEPHYVQELKNRYGDAVDWSKNPADDFSRATVHWRTDDGRELLTETTSSWCFVSAGIRHTFELLGPEYAMEVNMAQCGASVFFSREVTGDAGEDLVEKQNAEQGLMPVSPNEPAHYGYAGENRYFVKSFLSGTQTKLDFQDGVEVMRLLMAAYKSAAEDRAIAPTEPELETYRPFGKMRPD